MTHGSAVGMGAEGNFWHLLLLSLLLFPHFVVAATSMVTAAPSQLSAGGSTAITFEVFGSGGGGTADFRISVRDPSGQEYAVSKTSTTWQSGYARASAVFPLRISHRWLNWGQVTHRTAF